MKTFGKKLKTSETIAGASPSPLRGFVLDGSVPFKRGWALSIPHLPGVYLIHDLRGVLYVGLTAILAQRFEQHYSNTHNRPLSLALSVPVGVVMFSWCITEDPRRRARLERALIRALSPTCNQVLYERNQRM